MKIKEKKEVKCGLHDGTGTVAFLNADPGFNLWVELFNLILFYYFAYMFAFPVLVGFVFYFILFFFNLGFALQSSIMDVKFIGNSKSALLVGVNGCLSLCCPLIE